MVPPSFRVSLDLVLQETLEEEVLSLNPCVRYYNQDYMFDKIEKKQKETSDGPY